MNFENKTVIITGGAKGIGAACVKNFRRKNANVVILDIDEQGAELASAADDHVLFLKTDITVEAEVKNAIDYAAKIFGGIDVLVNNAAIQYYARVTECTVEQWDKTFAVNVRGGFLCAKYAIPYMQNRGAGVVINMSSVQAIVSQSQVAAYASSKEAQLGLTRCIAIDYAPEIRSVAICPGSVNTPLFQSLIAQSADPASSLRESEEMHLAKRLADPDEIAEFVAWLSSDHAKFITGQAFRIDGGLGIMIPGSKK
ncbi:SDR family NAD(P)-dependent oxidoreductase [Pollutibacter soli]|uniref:SDR family NAD(P)-dependent oxidoreductase n=1 Tax=Pollutibacter soli TaxID=3034157 RepID=UPI00301407FA